MFANCPNIITPTTPNYLFSCLSILPLLGILAPYSCRSSFVFSDHSILISILDILRAVDRTERPGMRSPHRIITSSHRHMPVAVNRDVPKALGKYTFSRCDDINGYMWCIGYGQMKYTPKAKSGTNKHTNLPTLQSNQPIAIRCNKPPKASSAALCRV